VLITRTAGWLAKRETQSEILPLAPAPEGAPLWKPAVDALAELSGEAFSRADVTVVLSSFFVRYTVVPGSDALSGMDQRLAFTRHCFSETYGADAEGWAVRASGSSTGKPLLACAVERALIDAIDQAMNRLGSRFSSLQPRLMASFNLYRKRFGDGTAWFVTLEPGLACLALLHGGEWQSVRTTRIGSEWPLELPALLTRETCLLDDAPECSEVLVHAPDGPHAQLPEAGGWRIEELAAGTA
jgi:hypothetical protein